MTAIASKVLALLAKEAKKRAARWVKADAEDLGEWRGKANFEAIDEVENKLFGATVGKTKIYHVTLDPDDPLRFFCYRSRLEYRPSLDFVCDLGSIHPLLRPVGGELLSLEPDDFRNSFLWHDDCYDKEGTWVRDPEAKDHSWTFVKLTRPQSDICMMWGLTAEGANNATLQAIYRAVRLGAGIPWKRHRKRDSEQGGSESAASNPDPAPLGVDAPTDVVVY